MTQTKGFTIIETILYIALLSGLLSSTYALLFSFSSLISFYSSELEIEKNGNFALQIIESQLINNNPLIIPHISSSTPITYFVTSSSTVSFFIKDHYFSITHAQ
jgi:hypothetical protein